MADRTWTGAVDGDWGTAGNWSPGSVPVASDDVYIVSGSVAIDGSDESAVTLGRLVVGPQYSGTIGSAATSLKIDSASLDFAGQGDAYIAGDHTTVTVTDTASSSTALELAAGTLTTLRVLGGKGTITVAADETVSTTLVVIGAEGVLVDLLAGVTIGGSATLTMDGGDLNTAETIPTIELHSGTLKMTADSGTTTTLEQYGGRVRWWPSAAITLTTATIYGGTFDASEATAPTFTITNCTLHEGATLDERSGLRNATFSNAVSIQGGEILYDAGRSVTVG